MKNRVYVFSTILKIILILVLPFISLCQTTLGDEPGNLPILIQANIPFYPLDAQAIGIQGEVKVIITTDGDRVANVKVEDGPPMLALAVQENLKSWKFKPHSPTTFSSIFSYKMLTDSACNFQNGSVTLHLPTEAIITARGLRTCDPVSKTTGAH